MTIDYSFTRYLAAKKSVDDRALNRSVWDKLARAVPSPPLRVLEIGAGIGTMTERVLEWGLMDEGLYTAVDVEPANIAQAKKRQTSNQALQVELEAIDIFDFVAREQGRRQWDLLIAHAVLDLLDIPTALPQLFSLLRPGGLFYFTLNFDGATILQPTIDPAFDALVEALYHRTMDKRITDGRPSGDSQTGRHLFQHLTKAGAKILAAGSSDWVVFGNDGRYPEDEAYFLHFIIHTMQGALNGRADLDQERFAAWIAQRHAQIEAGELVYIAHQIDFLGRLKPAASFDSH